MNEYTPQQLAAMVGLKGSRFITDLCIQGRFPGARKNANGRWRIPQDEALAWMNERTVDIEMLPPEGLAVAPRETAREFVLSVVSEVITKNEEEVSELKKKIGELEEQLAEEVRRNQEEVSEVRMQLSGVSERLAEMEKKKPSWWARLWGKG